MKDNRTILEAIVGSQAYGLATPTSDEDRLGVFLAPSQAFWGMGEVKETTVEKAPLPDRTMHELGKFCRLALKGNPTVNELLWLDPEQYVTRTREGQELIDLREAFLSQRTLHAYFGYIVGQIDRFEREGEVNRKLVRHAMRLTLQLGDLLDFGTITPRLADYQIKLVRAAEEDPDLVKGALRSVEKAPTNGGLPAEPDYDLVQDWLLQKRALNFCS